MSMSLIFVLQSAVDKTSRSLLTDPKLRKVILVEHPLLPLYIKEIIARILFDNLQVFPINFRGLIVNNGSKVPSISFASSHLLSLFAVGRITGLVLDCGHLESIALPVSLIPNHGFRGLRVFL